MLRFAIIGCGRISHKHASILAGSRLQDTTLVAVCDVVESKAKILADKYGVNYYLDYHKMIQSEDLDVLVVLVESGLHSPIVLDIAKYKKHIIVEKPIALTLQDADRMISECDKHGVKLFVVKQNRFNLPIKKLRDAIESRMFGKLVLGSIRVRWCRTQEYYDQDLWRGTWALDGGALTNQASHHIDMLLWMMGDVKAVFGYTARRLVNIEAEDTVVATIQFTSGALGSVEVTTATRPKDQEGSISILGEKGIVEVGGFAMNQLKTWEFSDSQISNCDLDAFTENPPDVYGFGHEEYYSHVVNSIVNNGPNLIDGISARKSLEIISAIYRSAESSLPVSLAYHACSSKLGIQ